MQEMAQIWREDWRGCGIGSIGGDYSPAGEYHVVPALAETGDWAEPTIHHSMHTASRGNWQVIADIEGHRLLEQTAHHPQSPVMPMLVAARTHPEPARISISLRPLAGIGFPRGLVFRYRHAGMYYAALWADGRLTLQRVHFDQRALLASAPACLDADEGTAVSVELTGREIIVRSGDVELLRAPDDTDGDGWSGGRVGLTAHHVTRFGPVTVEAPAGADAGSPPALRLPARSERAIVPRLWKRIDFGDWGTDRNLRWGDLDGDGRPEVVAATRTDRLGGDNFSTLASLAAFDLDGRRLWTLGEPSHPAWHTTSDLCFQLHDLDGAGRCQVIYCRDDWLIVADGATGRTLRRTRLPVCWDPKPISFHRLLGDSIAFADLTGSGRADCLLVKDRYNRLAAFTAQLELLWMWSGRTGHYPCPACVPGQAAQDIFVGYARLGPDGQTKWNLQDEVHDHADNVTMLPLHPGGDVHRPREGRVLWAASDAGFHLRDLDGRLIRHLPIGHGQSLCIANLDPGREGLEILCNTFWGAAGITCLMDEGGNLLAESEPMPYACLLQPVNWVACRDGRLAADLVLLSAHPLQGGLMDGHGRRQVMLPDDGHPWLCSDARDLDGDGLDEVLAWDERSLWIYRADVPGRTSDNYPHRNPWYNDSNYRAQISLPNEITCARTRGATV